MNVNFLIYLLEVKTVCCMLLGRLNEKCKRSLGLGIHIPAWGLILCWHFRGQPSAVLFPSLGIVTLRHLFCCLVLTEQKLDHQPLTHDLDGSASNLPQSLQEIITTFWNPKTNCTFCTWVIITIPSNHNMWSPSPCGIQLSIPLAFLSSLTLNECHRMF